MTYKEKAQLETAYAAAVALQDRVSALEQKLTVALERLSFVETHYAKKVGRRGS